MVCVPVESCDLACRVDVEGDGAFKGASACARGVESGEALRTIAPGKAQRAQGYAKGERSFPSDC
jgi:hypothetical protein